MRGHAGAPGPGFLDGENSASGGVLHLPQGRNRAELSHHTQGIPIAVGIHDFSASDMVNGHTVHRYFYVFRWNSHEIAFVCARNGPAGNYFVLLGNRVLDGPAQIGVALEEARNLALVCFRTDGGTEYVGALESMAGGDEFVYNFKLSFVPDFFVEASNDGFVLSRHENCPPRNDSIGHPRRSGPCLTAPGIEGMGG